MRIVHYLNQFFAGIGGEDAAGQQPDMREGANGPGRALAALLPSELQIVATIFCGDDYAAETPEAAERLLQLARSAGAELVVAGPAFESGRYGLACARVAAAAARAGIPAIAAMHPDNPGLAEAGAAAVVATGGTARQMRKSLELLASATAKLAAGHGLTADDGRIGQRPRRNRFAERAGAERAVALVLARLAGDREATEVPIPSFGSVTPATPLQDPGSARIALLTEGALVPAGNPDRLESARATRWLRYTIEGIDALEPRAYESVHGGFSTVAANEDPNRMLPLDAARKLEREGAIGALHREYLTTVGNGTQVAMARSFGEEWASALRDAGVQAAILTST
jgi:glycine reductase